MQAGLSEDVELEVQDGAVVIRSVTGARAGWAEAAAALAEAEEIASGSMAPRNDEHQIRSPGTEPLTPNPERPH